VEACSLNQDDSRRTVTLREGEVRPVYALPTHLEETNTGKAQGDPRGPPEAAPPSRAKAREATRSDYAWILRVPRRTDEHPMPGQLPHPGYPVVASCAAAPQSTRRDELGTREPTGYTMDSDRACSAFASVGALRRSNPRQESSALAAPARICVGGGSSREMRAVPTAIVLTSCWASKKPGRFSTQFCVADASITHLPKPVRFGRGATSGPSPRRRRVVTLSHSTRKVPG
jgi:hypothetical protein